MKVVVKIYKNNREGTFFYTMGLLIPVVMIGVGLFCMPVIHGVTDHTFFTMRPHFQATTPEANLALRASQLVRKDRGHKPIIAVAGYMSFSDDDERLARYFMPYGKTSLYVSEYNNSVDANRVNSVDLEARNFNIETNNGTFASQIIFEPEQQVAGLGIIYWQPISVFENGNPRFWFQLSAPFEVVRNRVGMTENIINDGGGAVDAIGLDGGPRVDSMSAAFEQSTWQYGKIIDNCCWLKKSGIADIEFKLGYNATCSERAQTYGYLGMVIPTGNKPTGEYLFEPMVGNNGHWGLMFGGHMSFTIWSDCTDVQHRVSVEYDLNTRFLFSNHQVRTFDLYDKSWSRYMEMYANQGQAVAAAVAQDPRAGTSGINLMTKCVEVYAHFSTMINTALIYQWHHLMLEGGYNAYARQAEEICACFDDEAAIKDISGQGNTNILRTMRYNAPCAAIAVDNYAAFPVADIDINSACHPACIAHTIYGALEYVGNHPHNPLIGFFGSYEFSKVNTALDRWQVGITASICC
jgi:hypothetical protein